MIWSKYIYILIKMDFGTRNIINIYIYIINIYIINIYY